MSTRREFDFSGVRMDSTVNAGLTSMDESTIRSGELTVRQAEQRGETLTEAKDKAQLTATTAMSIVHITLMKEVLDNGPSTPYYYASLSLSRYGQVLVGIIAIATTNLRKYYDRYHDVTCDDFLENLCCCKWKSSNSVRRRNRLRAAIRRSGDDGLDLGHWNVMEKGGTTADGDETTDGSNFEDEEVSCCTNPICRFTRRVHSDYEYDILERYDLWCQKTVQAKLNSVEPRAELSRLRAFIEGAKAEMSLLEAKMKTSDSENEDTEIRLKTLSGKINEANEWARKQEQVLMSEKILEMQGKILHEYSDAILKKRVLKMVSYWQNGINYMLYFVFIINAFIAGLSLAGNGAGGGTNSATEQVNTSSPASNS